MVCGKPRRHQFGWRAVTVGSDRVDLGTDNGNEGCCTTVSGAPLMRSIQGIGRALRRLSGVTTPCIGSGVRRRRPVRETIAHGMMRCAFCSESFRPGSVMLAPEWSLGCDLSVRPCFPVICHVQ